MMREMTVYFAKDDVFRDTICYGFKSDFCDANDVRRLFDKGQYEPVYTGEFAELEGVFAHCQNIDEAWRDPPCRSMAVGDIIKDGDDLFVVASFGFDKL